MSAIVCLFFLDSIKNWEKHPEHREADKLPESFYNTDIADMSLKYLWLYRCIEMDLNKTPGDAGVVRDVAAACPFWLTAPPDLRS